MKMIPRLFVIALLLPTLFFYACSEKAQDGDTKAALSAFLKDNDQVVAFGNTRLKDILTKTSYESVPKFGVLLRSEMATLERFIDMNEPIYYAMEGPIDNNGPQTVYAFIKVKNIDSLSTELMLRGFEVDELDGMKYTTDGDFSLGLKGQLGIVIVKASGFENEKMMAAAFEKASGKMSGGKIDEILSQKSDVVVGMSVSNLYNTSETDLNKLSKEKQKEIKALVEDSYVQTVFKFEDGAAIVETKNLFSDALMKRMFMNKDGGASIMSYLGSGKPRFGLSVNMDMVKMQQFVDEFSPNAINELARSMGGPAQLALMSAGKDGLSALLSGKLGMLMIAEPDEEGAIEPDFNLHVGLTQKGMDLGNLAKEFLAYSMDEIRVDENGFSGFSNEEYSIPGKVILPEGCEDFGKSGISAFFSFEGINFDDFDLEGEENVLRVVKYVTFEYNNEGGRLYVKAKDGKENVLKQAMEVVIESLSADISQINI